MKALIASIALLCLTASVRAESGACDQARQDALEPIGKMVQSTLALANATTGGCDELKRAWKDYQQVHAASEAALQKVEAACGLPPSAKKSDQRPIEELIRSCDAQK